MAEYMVKATAVYVDVKMGGHRNRTVLDAGRRVERGETCELDPKDSWTIFAINATAIELIPASAPEPPPPQEPKASKED